MPVLYYWIIKTIAGSIIGSAFSAWFENTLLGVWMYAKIDQIMNWAAKRYDLSILEREDRFLKKYPNVAKRIADLEAKINVDNSQK